MNSLSMEDSPFPLVQLPWLHLFAYRFPEDEIVYSQTEDKSPLLEVYV